MDESNKREHDLVLELVQPFVRQGILAFENDEETGTALSLRRALLSADSVAGAGVPDVAEQPWSISRRASPTRKPMVKASKTRAAICSMCGASARSAVRLGMTHNGCA